GAGGAEAADRGDRQAAEGDLRRPGPAAAEPGQGAEGLGGAQAVREEVRRPGDADRDAAGAAEGEEGRREEGPEGAGRGGQGADRGVTPQSRYPEPGAQAAPPASSFWRAVGRSFVAASFQLAGGPKGRPTGWKPVATISRPAARLTSIVTFS